MNRHWTQFYKWYRLLGALAVMLAISMLVACGASNTPTPQPQLAAVVDATTTAAFSTATPTDDPDRILNPTEAIETANAVETPFTAHVHEIQTMEADPTRLPYTPGLRYLSSPEPTATWSAGFVPCPPPHSTFQPQYFSCWNSAINSRLMWLSAGIHQQEGDPQQGVLEVGFFDLDQASNPTDDAYDTPQAVGRMTITDVTGTLVTLVSDNHIPPVSFVFDITTRQWVSPSPGPSPSTLPTSGPSPSAEPSPEPSPSP